MDVSKFKLQATDFKMIKADHWSLTGDNLVLKGNVFLPAATYDIYADQVVINVKNRDFDARGNLRLHQKMEETKTVKPGEMAQFEDVAGITYQIDGITTDVFGHQKVKVKYQRIGASLTASSVSGNIMRCLSHDTFLGNFILEKGVNVISVDLKNIPSDFTADCRYSN
ncbi:MAG: hypothetical protein IKZ31_04655, partial [Lentisphaeria bacterium]|nr:hypothetical protein [Lentisphaeria bacterium]